MSFYFICFDGSGVLLRWVDLDCLLYTLLLICVCPNANINTGWELMETFFTEQFSMTVSFKGRLYLKKTLTILNQLLSLLLNYDLLLVIHSSLRKSISFCVPWLSNLGVVLLVSNPLWSRLWCIWNGQTWQTRPPLAMSFTMLSRTVATATSVCLNHRQLLR